VIQSLLEGVSKTSPPIVLLPTLVKFLGKTFNSWHTAIYILQSYAGPSKIGSELDENKFTESSLDCEFLFVYFFFSW